MGSIKQENSRASELQILLRDTIADVIDFVRETDVERSRHERGSPAKNNEKRCPLVDPASLSAQKLEHLLRDFLSETEHGDSSKDFQQRVQTLLRYSVNTSHPGFLDKLYAAPLPPGVVGDLLLGVLNTNLHIYQVSPVLTLVEKTVTKRLASMFGLNGPRSGGLSGKSSRRHVSVLQPVA